MNLELDGISPLINRLEKFDKDISKELKKEMRKAASEGVDAARSGYPEGRLLRKYGKWIELKSGRDLSYDVRAVRKGVYLKTDRKRVRGATVNFGYTIGNRSAVGAIIEWAGKEDQRDIFNATIIRKYGPAGKMPRFAPNAYYEVMPQVRDKIESLVQAAMRKVGL